ncbi:C4-dicarboxylate ABC transporter substrate-binding protein [Aquicoccus porphyridii]|uniref:C4-dicarboxylate ABC transporter substrate-binding protein n=1 Tax=Aquicoccus porphyridii TaxID=1852029 RepID=A0A5A9ZTK9_9RHOB|nr:TRAP transporter substrate-binding protein DctP [Aquicoccus porphyridii]KAA0920431.1 C4-dicarboxylate ABC transporter substrate-binding protein [Aquicoccus porphyridii]RAI54783.1 C4-dicarboxylate ABC transporter substrate-binding protein [Rhodobacteraceae bacterium AsT-22]
MRHLLGGLAAAAMLAVTPVMADTTLRITLQLPLKSHLGQNLLMFKEEVEAKSDMKIEIYDSAQLYRDNEVPQAVGAGEIEMGVASLTRYVGEIPAVDIFYMPFVLNTEEKVRAAVAPDSPVRGPIDDAIRDTGSHVLWWQAYGGSVLLSKGEPLRGPEDMAGKKARVFGKWLGEWVNVLGGAPTLISGSEQFLAYQRGTVDIGMTGVSGVVSRKLWEVMDTITAVNNADIEFIVVINEDVWEGLSDEQRNILTTAARNAETSVRDYMSEFEANAFKEAEANGMTVHFPTDEEIAAWREASAPVIEAWLAESGELGQQLLDAAESF